MASAVKLLPILPKNFPVEPLIWALGALCLLGSFWYLTLRIYLNFNEKAWSARFAAEVERRSAAEAANQVKAEFLAHMSHEIRTPLHAIEGFTELALQSPLNVELRQYLDTVRTSAGWLVHIVNDIVEFARIEAGVLSLNNVPFSVEECVVSALNIVRPEAEARHLSVKCRVDPTIPAKVGGDSTRLLQVLFNLVQNAVKFTTSGGVVMTADLVPPPQSPDSTRSPATAAIRFAVADTGIGIPADVLEDIFAPAAHPLDSAGLLHNDTRWKSSAFGLSICHKLVRMMGGAIQVQSHLGAGTTVEFTLAFEVAPQPAAEVSPFSSLRPFERMLSILVADEKAADRRLAKDLLESAGHSVTEDADGKQLLAAAAGHNFDLILVNVEMANLDAFDGARRLRAGETLGVHAAIYGVAGPAFQDGRERCRAAGMDGFLAKPIDADSILNLAAALASRPQAVAALLPREAVSSGGAV